MNADMIAAWAVENGFLRIGLGNYRRHDNAGAITFEIKRLSYLLIDEKQGFRARLISRLFKDMTLPGAGESLQAPLSIASQTLRQAMRELRKSLVHILTEACGSGTSARNNAGSSS